jgi:hypothetical protein
VALWATIVTLREKRLKLAKLLPSRCQHSRHNERYGHEAPLLLAFFPARASGAPPEGLQFAPRIVGNKNKELEANAVEIPMRACLNQLMEVQRKAVGPLPATKAPSRSTDPRYSATGHERHIGLMKQLLFFAHSDHLINLIFNQKALNLRCYASHVLASTGLRTWVSCPMLASRGQGLRPMDLRRDAPGRSDKLLRSRRRTYRRRNADQDRRCAPLG